MSLILPATNTRSGLVFTALEKKNTEETQSQIVGTQLHLWTCLHRNKMKYIYFKSGTVFTRLLR